MTRITRVEVIDENGRSYVSWEDDNDVSWQFQDDGKTLKVFVNKVKPKTGEEGALEALEKFQNDWLLGKKCPETKLEIKNLNSVESIKAEIKLLQKKLDLLEEIEKQPKTLFDVIQNLGYSVDCSWEIVDAIEEFETQKEKEMIKRNLKTSLQEMVNGDVRPIDDVVKEAKEEYPYKKYTPEETAESLRNAMRTAKEEGVFDTTKESWMNKPVEELVEMLEKNPPDCLKFVMGKTLEDIVTRWWCDTFTGTHEKWSMEECIDDLIDQIELFLPRSQSSEGTQSVYTEVAVEAHNELLQKIKSKLRNKK
jgi:hypothetical protein